MKKKGAKSVTTQVLLMIGLVIAVNIISAQLYFRLDLTADRSYTLSKATKNILRSLEEPVTVTAYFTEDVPPQLLQARTDFKDLLIEYSNVAKGNLVYEFIDPNKDQESETKAMQEGIMPNIVNVRDLQHQLGMDTGYSDIHALATLLLRKFEETNSIEESVQACMNLMDGAYSVTGIIDDGTLFAFKDPMGIKPLCYGKNEGVHAFSSESVGLDINGIAFDHELQPGELISIKDQKHSRKQVIPWKSCPARAGTTTRP